MKRERYLEIRRTFQFEKSLLQLFKHILVDIGLMALIVALHFQASIWQFLGAPVLAVLMFRGFSLMHEAAHGAISKNKKINDMVGVIWGAISLLPFENWKKSHLEHHSWSGNVDKDPVMAMIHIYPRMKKGSRQFLTRVWNFWIPILAFIQYGVFWVLSLAQYLREPRSVRMIISLAASIFGWLALGFAGFQSGFTGQVILPGLALYFLMVEVVNLPHHLQMPQAHGEARFPVWEQAMFVRTCLYPRWFARHVVLNFNYHTEHHLFPDVPWYHLEKLHEILKTQLGAEMNADPSLQWIRRNRPKNLDLVVVAADLVTSDEKDLDQAA